ncbi:restriction endonuclease subunit S [Vibrio parahaemolyticus]|nr:restriction endonuclease subunit S [Vibrio parahaemolyticus]
MDNLIRIKDIANLKSIKSSDIGALSYLPLEEVESWNGRVKKYQKNEDFSGDVNLFECGDVLFNKLRPYLAKVVHADRDGGVSNEAMVLEPLKNINGRYLFYKLLSSDFITMIDSYTYGTKMPRANPLDIMTSKINLPDLQLQEDLVSKLDFKSEAVDKQIKALTQKLHHLEEYKTALIHNAVTKGLDANNCRILDGTPAEDMKWKDSGIEWIGDIPDGWKLIKLKDYFNVTMGETILKEDLSDESFGIPVYSATKEDVVFGYVNNASKLLNPGDIVIAARGNSIGNPNIISALSTSTQTTIQLNKKRKVNSEFIKYWMLGSHDEIFKFDNTAIPQFTVDDSKNIVSVMPGSDETLRICNYLSKKLEVLKVSKETINKKIALLLEYKKSLINEAVSGQ